MLNYYPTALYRAFSLKNIDLSDFEDLIEKYLRKRKYPLWLPTDGTTIYSINNYDSKILDVTDEDLLEYYETRLKRVLPKNVRLGIGNINTFLQNVEKENGDIDERIASFFKGQNEGLSIHVSEKNISALVLEYK